MKSKLLYFTNIGRIGDNKWSMNLKFFPFLKKHLLIEGDFAQKNRSLISEAAIKPF